VSIKGLKDKGIVKFTIEDSREGWVDSVRELLNSYFHKTSPLVIYM
jgi:hypothetical protein